MGAPISLAGWQSIQIVGASACVIFILLQKIQKMTKCTFWYRLSQVVLDTVQRALKWLCCMCVCINDLMPIQQIICHAQRVFVKANQFTAISNYRIKTLTLWACELKQQSWWIDTNIIRVCVTLLRSLAWCLTTKDRPHYLLNSGRPNLVDQHWGGDN